MRLVLFVICAVALVGCEFRMTEGEQAAVKAAGATACGLFGLPPYVGESLIGGVLALLGVGGVRTYRKRSKKAPASNG